MNVLITGGAGYIGSHVNRFLSLKGISTIVLDDLSRGHKESVASGLFIKGDLGDKSLLNSLMSEYQIDAIIHFGAFSVVSESVTYPAKYYNNNVSNMITLLDAAVAHKIGYFVFSSSAAIFGEPKYVPIDENHPKEPINPYGKTKLVGEEMLADYAQAYGIRYCSLRYFNAAGASKDGLTGESHNPEHHLIPLVLKTAIIGNSKLKVFGTDYHTKDGSCLRDYIHVEDLADVHYKGLKYIMENNVSDVFNMGSGNGYTVLEIIRACEKITGREIKFEIAQRRPGDPASLLASNEKVKRILGWEPQNDIDAIIRDAWNWENSRRF